MTVCIAAICEDGNRIVMASDCKIGSEGFMSADMPVSKYFDMENWTVMFSGTFGDGTAISKDIHRRLTVNGSNTGSGMIQIASSAFQKRIAEVSSFPVLSPFDMSLEEFKKEGKDTFPAETHSELSADIKRNADNFTAGIIVSGWGYREFAPHLFTVDRFGVTPRDTEGFAVSGSGSYAAQAMLMFHAQTSLKCVYKGMSMATAVLYICAAKFFAERVDGVGRNTMLRIATRGQRSARNLNCVDEIRAWWNKYSSPGLVATDQEAWANELVRKDVPE